MPNNPDISLKSRTNTNFILMTRIGTNNVMQK
jgi:hypothetical protein